jgi:hypothetical protein
VILVEGWSDAAALAAVAHARGRDLGAEGVRLVAMGGATNLATHLRRYGPAGLGLRLAGLCDAGEQGAFRTALEREGLGADLTPAAMAALGFHICHADLEDELIRALGAAHVERIVADAGEQRQFRTFQAQPAQRDRPIEAQLRRFLGTHSGRKLRYGTLLAEALDPERVPPPLDLVLAAV